jgi:hypothetical protein
VPFASVGKSWARRRLNPLKMSKGLEFRHKLLLDAFGVVHNDTLSSNSARRPRTERDCDVSDDGSAAPSSPALVERSRGSDVVDNVSICSSTFVLQLASAPRTVCAAAESSASASRQDPLVFRVGIRNTVAGKVPS